MHHALIHSFLHQGHADRTVRVYGIHPACPKSVLKAAVTDAIVKDDTGICFLHLFFHY